ncbi:glycosyl transferase group 1 [Neisseria gonorrhoeae]|uniref:glycosyl transferase group 1 n=1 Tax=Neisseria gonorrhoeae TaxID=485 RepID=UPI003982FE2A
MSEPLHVLVIPLWYPRSEQDVDGIFFQNQAQALQRKGIKTAILTPMFRYLRKETASILTGPYGFARYRQSGLDIYAWRSMYFFPAFRLSTSTASAGCAPV